MFEFDIKEIFMDSLYEIVLVLSAIHLGVVMVSFLRKWIHPYRSNMNYDKCLTMDQFQFLFENQITKKENKSIYKNLNVNNSAISEGEYTALIKYLKKCVDVSSISSEIFEKRFNKGNLLNELTLEIDKAINIRKLIRDSLGLQKRKNTSEAQINITSSDSSDSFESACSYHSDSEESNLLPTNLRLGNQDLITSQEKTNKIFGTDTVKHNDFLDVNSVTSIKKVLKTCVESQIEETRYDYEKSVSQEKKILELITNQLKTIEDQIKVLKECRYNFDSCDTDNSLESNIISSSVSGLIYQSECSSGESSTTYTSDLTSIQSNFTMLEHKFWKSFVDEKTSLLSKPKTKNSTLKNYKLIHSVDQYTSKSPKEICILGAGQPANHTLSLNKRSPNADIYIKLPNCSSQTTNFSKHRGPSYNQKSSEKGVTCHINLNINLGAVTLSNTSVTNFIKEPEVQLVLSDPDDDILSETSL